MWHNWVYLVEDIYLYFSKKYIYTINHKRIALNYLFFILWSALSGLSLATMIRWELAYPGSHFFKGDSLRYLQVITAHGLTMVFYVVVPAVFGFLANFIIPYHVGSKDVAFPRLNSIGFWFLPAGFLLISKPAFIRSNFFKYYDKPSFYYNFLDLTCTKNCLETLRCNLMSKDLTTINLNNLFLTEWGVRKKITFLNFGVYTFIPYPYLLQTNINNYMNSFWYSSLNLFKLKKKKNLFDKMLKLNINYVGVNFYYAVFF
jgi:hypothetical protein